MPALRPAPPPSPTDTARGVAELSLVACVTAVSLGLNRGCAASHPSSRASRRARARESSPSLRLTPYPQPRRVPVARRLLAGLQAYTLADTQAAAQARLGVALGGGQV